MDLLVTVVYILFSVVFFMTVLLSPFFVHCFFFNDTATTEIYTRSLVGSVRCV